MKKIRFIIVISILLPGIFSILNCGTIDSALKQEREKNERNRINTTDDKINQLLRDGAKAYDEKNFDLAVKKFDEGFKTDPTFPGSAPVFLNNKALALIGRGTETYNKSIKTDEATRKAAKESARNDFKDAIYSSENALEVLKTAPAESVDFQKTFEANILSAFTNRKNAYRLLSQTGADRTQGKTALNVFHEYMGVETDPAKKAKAQLELALTLQDSDEFELAVAEFQKILETDADNVDALAGAGLNLVNVGYANTDPEKGREQLKEAEKYLRHYVLIAPAEHKFKQEAQGIIESLKDAENPRKANVSEGYSIGKTGRFSESKTTITEPIPGNLGKTEEK